MSSRAHLRQFASLPTSQITFQPSQLPLTIAGFAFLPNALHGYDTVNGGQAEWDITAFFDTCGGDNEWLVKTTSVASAGWTSTLGFPESNSLLGNFATAFHSALNALAILNVAVLADWHVVSFAYMGGGIIQASATPVTLHFRFYGVSPSYGSAT